MDALKKQKTLGLPLLEPPFEGPAQKMFAQQAAVGSQKPLKASLVRPFIDALTSLHVKLFFTNIG
jgi:hypothetical protein